MASQNFTGIVEVVKKNDQGYWSIKTADGAWFGHSKTKPVCEEGDEVAFDYSQNGKYSNVDPDTMEVLSSGNKVEKAAKPAWKKNNSGAVDTSKDEYWKRKEERDVFIQNEIRKQASRNAAIAILDSAMKNGVLVIPEPSKKGSSRMEVLLAYVDKVADRFEKSTKATNEIPEVMEKKKIIAAPRAAVAAVEAPEFEENEAEGGF